MIPVGELKQGSLYIGVHNRNGPWEEDTMMWDGRDFYPEGDLNDPMWPPSPYGYFNLGSPFATFLPIQDTGRDYEES